METKLTNSGVDLLVSFDTTGSMYPVLAQVRQNVASFVGDMFESINDIRVGIIAHGDYCDKNNPYTIRVMDLTDNKDKICEFIRTTDKTWGGDADECYELVMNTARTTVNWGAGRTKVFVMIGDASPHGVNYPDNKDKIDWRNEAGLLNELGVKVFAVHALSYYRSSSRNFYQTIADMTQGKYLTLDQFDEVIDLIKATCIAEYSEEKLNEFVSIIKSNGRMTKTMARNISRLSGTEVEADTKGVQKDGLVPVEPGRFQVMKVPENCVIRDFVESNGIVFKKGRGFYELTKHETVQQYKEVIMQDRVTGEMFTGAQVREKLGLKPQTRVGGVKESLSSRSTHAFRVFVQSTSYNRKLIGGTTFLYEISDLADTGTIIETTPDIKVEVKEDKADMATKKSSKATKRAVKAVAKTETKAEPKVVEEETKVEVTKVEVVADDIPDEFMTEVEAVAVASIDDAAGVEHKAPVESVTIEVGSLAEALGISSIGTETKDAAVTEDTAKCETVVESTVKGDKKVKKSAKKSAKKTEKSAKKAEYDKEKADKAKKINEEAEEILRKIEEKTEVVMTDKEEKEAKTDAVSAVIVSCSELKKIPTVKTTSKHYKNINSKMDKLMGNLKGSVPRDNIVESKDDVIKALESALKYFKSI